MKRFEHDNIGIIENRLASSEHLKMAKPKSPPFVHSIKLQRLDCVSAAVKTIIITQNEVQGYKKRVACIHVWRSSTLLHISVFNSAIPVSKYQFQHLVQ